MRFYTAATTCPTEGNGRKSSELSHTKSGMLRRCQQTIGWYVKRPHHLSMPCISVEQQHEMQDKVKSNAVTAEIMCATASNVAY